MLGGGDAYCGGAVSGGALCLAGRGVGRGVVYGCRRSRGRREEVSRAGGSWAPSVGRRAPELEYVLHVGANMVASLEALYARHQQLVIGGLVVTHGRHHRAGDCLRV